MLSICLVLCVILLCVFTLLVPCCDVRYDFRFVFTLSCLQEGSCLNYVGFFLCLPAYSDVQHMLFVYV